MAWLAILVTLAVFFKTARSLASTRADPQEICIVRGGNAFVRHRCGIAWLAVAWEVETPRAVAARARAKLLFAEAFTVLLETAALFAAAGLQLVLFQALHKLLIH